jgi:serine/threonine-protein kinase MRCK
VRRAEKSRREMELKIQELEASRDHFDAHSSSRSNSDLGSSQSIGLSSETFRLEIERMEIEFTEKLNQQQSRYNQDLTILKNQLGESETHRAMLQIELQERTTNLRVDGANSSDTADDIISEVQMRHDCEIKMLLEDNKKLIMDLEILSEANRHMQSDRMQIESEMEELRTKQKTYIQWENQVSEIIQWVSDEKDARIYLQALATKMTEELEYLKSAGTKENWRNRRSQKLDKMELLNLSQNLQSEIQAKSAISDELSRTRVELAAAQKDLKDTKQHLGE